MGHNFKVPSAEQLQVMQSSITNRLYPYLAECYLRSDDRALERLRDVMGRSGQVLKTEVLMLDAGSLESIEDSLDEDDPYYDREPEY